MKVLVTGASGQLGLELKKCLNPKDTFFADHARFDLTDEASMESAIKAFGPEVVVNCAAYTAVDRAENDVEACYDVNAAGVGKLARLACKYGFRIIHISTDYVFDGDKACAYTEDDIVNPLSVYGSSKAEGERLLMSEAPDSIIIRTGWLYSAQGKNFVRSILSKALAGEDLRIVDDQTGTPTYAGDLAQAIKDILHSPTIPAGIYHYSNDGSASWYDFGKEVCSQAGAKVNVTAIKTADYPAAAVRPRFSVLDKSKIKKVFGGDVPHWRDSLHKCISEILSNK